MEEHMPTQSLELGEYQVPLSTLIERSNFKKKRRHVRKLKSEIKEMMVLEKHIKSENALLKETSAKIRNENEPLRKELKMLKEINQEYIQEKIQIAGESSKGYKLRNPTKF
jgi:hypothetical protein